MAKYDFDLFVIGAGSGGIRAARIAAGFGANVAIAEADSIGGTCVNLGCVPKKLFVNASHFADDFRNAKGYGWNIDQIHFNWQTLLLNKNREIQRLNQFYAQRLNKSGATLITGKARLVDSNTITVNNKTWSAKIILIATGAGPVVPDIPGSQHAITSNQAFFLEQLPRRIIIVGGGYIAIEFAGIFNGLGVDVTLLNRGQSILRGFDHQASAFLTEEITKKGITIINSSTVNHIEKIDHWMAVRSEDGNEYETDMLMFATGRKPNTAGLGLENAGVKTDAKAAIIIDEQYRSTTPSIYAIGDVTNRLNLTPVAIAEGAAFASSVFGNQITILDYKNIPTCVFSQPALASVGLTESGAREHFDQISVYKTTFTPLKYTLTGSNEKCFIKLITDRKTDVVVGAHMVGADAGEIIQGIAIAIKAGATKSQFDATIGIHPTIAEEFVTLS